MRVVYAGGDQDDWFRIIDLREGDLRLIHPDGEGACRWRGWLARPAGRRDPDEPPPALAARTKSVFEVLDAAVAVSRLGIAAGAGGRRHPRPHRRPFAEPPGHLRRHSRDGADLRPAPPRPSPVERLVVAGASLNTRLLSVGETACAGTVEFVRCLLANGARPDGWIRGSMEL